jgi:excisionase family DNA binding protein
MEIQQLNQPLEPLVGAEEAAEYLGFSALTVRRMAHEGRLPSIAFPVGRTGKFTHRFRFSELKAYLSTLERQPIPISVVAPTTITAPESHANL